MSMDKKCTFSMLHVTRPREKLLIMISIISKDSSIWPNGKIDKELNLTTLS